jgi:hypothetical protein
MKEDNNNNLTEIKLKALRAVRWVCSVKFHCASERSKHNTFLLSDEAARSIPTSSPYLVLGKPDKTPETYPFWLSLALVARSDSSPAPGSIKNTAETISGSSTRFSCPLRSTVLLDWCRHWLIYTRFRRVCFLSARWRAGCWFRTYRTNLRHGSDEFAHYVAGFSCLRIFSVWTLLGEAASDQTQTWEVQEGQETRGSSGVVSVTALIV